MSDHNDNTPEALAMEWALSSDGSRCRAWLEQRLPLDSVATAMQYAGRLAARLVRHGGNVDGVRIAASTYSTRNLWA